ncbi:Abi family protein [Brevibacterium aurantiacum]|uniref:Abi family protein n=1 Tax=Brevibacterium aurantiacum TaxID=273384 RepID=A0A556C5Q4_BREAU|nr:Abi family protein [Brevibacterium aurantiacum]
MIRELLPTDQINATLHEYRTGTYIPGANFEHVIALEAFDMKVARICLDGTLDFEIRLRASIAHALSRLDPAAHLDQGHLDASKCNKPISKKPSSPTKFEAWKRTVDEAIKNSKPGEDFVAHHLAKYPGQPLPVWAVTEILSFGSLPYLFELMKSADARAVANDFGFMHPAPFGKVIRAAADLRNYCAHGSRLFNRRFKREQSISQGDTVGPMLDHISKPDYSLTSAEGKRLYVNAAVLAFMLKSHSEPSDWPAKFRDHIRSFGLPLTTPSGHHVVTPERDMGFPESWHTNLLWH